MSGAVVEVQGLVRQFGDRTALDGVDLTVRSGSIVALLGPNGSGKTTLLKILAGLIRPTAGSIRVFGLDAFKDRPTIMQRARFAFAPPSWYPNLTARETLTALSGIGRRDRREIMSAQIEWALELVGLTDRADDRVRVFSFGMRQRLALAQALLPRPDLLVLDEPADGLDPLAILELRDILRRLRTEHGMTIILSSHMLLEVERLVDGILLLNEGRVLLAGTPSELNGTVRYVRLTVAGGEAELRRMHEAIMECGIKPLLENGTSIELPRGALTMQEAHKLAAANGLTLSGFAEHAPTLEDAVIDRLRRARRTDAQSGDSQNPAPLPQRGGASSC